MSKETTDYKNLPLFYRLVLKLPKLSLEGFSLEFQGLFWALIAPIFIVGDIFLGLLVLTWLPFPSNYVTMVTVTALILLLMTRIYVERMLNARNALIGQASFRWDIDGALEGYLRLLERKKESEKSKARN